MRMVLVLLVWAGFSVSGLADDQLLQRDDVKKALAYIQANQERTLASQVAIAEIPAPTFHEGERAKYMASEFRRVGLANVEIDKQGNVLGWRNGEVKDTLVLAAHLDIAFEPGVKTRLEKRERAGTGPDWPTTAAGSHPCSPSQKR